MLKLTTLCGYHRGAGNFQETAAAAGGPYAAKNAEFAKVMLNALV